MAQYDHGPEAASWCNFPANGRFPACARKVPAGRVANHEPVFHAHTPAHAAPAGEIVLDRYRLERRIGAGGMGVVYLARDEELERDVAVKRIAVELDPDGRGEREALAAARLAHPAIVGLYAAGRDDDAIYLVSELVRGRTLAELERDGDLSDRDVVEIGVALCDALAHAHSRGVVHRDVKPSNVLCPDSRHEGGAVAKLADFGIAMMADGDVLTRTGDIMGTLAYMAPEQARGKGVTGAADVYALGVVLYEGLAGVNPIRAGNPAATARRVGMRLPPLGRVRRDLPAALCHAIDAAVAPETASRSGLGALRIALSEAVDRVADEPGPVASEAGLAETALMAPERTRRRGEPGAPRARPGSRRAEPDLREDTAPLALGPVNRFDATLPQDAEQPRGRRAAVPPAGRQDAGRHDEREPPDGSVALPPRWVDREFAGEPASARPAEREGPGRAARRWRARAAAAGGAALLAGAALAWIGPEPPVDPLTGGAVVAATVLLLPRLGWLAAAAALVAWLAAAAPGIALLAVLAAAPVPLLLSWRGTAWSLPAVAPLLGVAGLAGAWPALAGQARDWWTRAALGALGGLWLVLAEALASERLLFGQPRAVLPAGAWDESALDAARDALAPLLTGGTLAIAALWALAAALLPVLVRGRSAAIDLVAAAGWAAALAAATQALGEALVLDAPRGLVVGAIVAAAVAVGARAVRGGA